MYQLLIWVFISVITKAFGLNCNAKEASNSGFGEAYHMADQAARTMRKGFGVSMKMEVML